MGREDDDEGRDIHSALDPRYVDRWDFPLAMNNTKVIKDGDILSQPG